MSSIIYLTAVISPVKAETITIDEDKAREQITRVDVSRGQPSPIIFDNGEIIKFVKLGDVRKNVYSFNSPIEEGKSSSIYITQIEELDLPGTTKASSPILSVETIDSDGERQHYDFILQNDSDRRSKISIEPTQPEPILEPEPPKVITTINTSYGIATPEDVQLGLEVSIAQKQISSDSKLANNVREYVAQTRNGIAAIEAIKNADLPLSVIEKLGEIGQQEDTKRRLLPLEAKF